MFLQDINTLLASQSRLDGQRRFQSQIADSLGGPPFLWVVLVIFLHETVVDHPFLYAWQESEEGHEKKQQGMNNRKGEKKWLSNVWPTKTNVPVSYHCGHMSLCVCHQSYCRPFAFFVAKKAQKEKQKKKKRKERSTNIVQEFGHVVSDRVGQNNDQTLTLLHGLSRKKKEKKVKDRRRHLEKKERKPNRYLGDLDGGNHGGTSGTTNQETFFFNQSARHGEGFLIDSLNPFIHN